MNESTRKKIIYIFFASAMLWGGYNFLPSEKSKPITDTVQSRPEATTVVGGNNMRKEAIVSSSINVSSDKNKSWGRNPFVNAMNPIKNFTPKTENKLWKLSGIIYNNQSPVAIINKKPVSIGDNIDQAIVTEINKKNVIIELNGKKITLLVNKG